MVVFHPPHPGDCRDSPSPHQQSRKTPPTSSTSSSPRKYGINSNKSLPPPLKLASPTSELPSTVQSLLPLTQQHHSSGASTLTYHPTIILPSATTTGLTNSSSSSLASTGGLFSSSSHSTMSGSAISNGLPRTSLPSATSKLYNSSGGVTQIQALPTISAAALTNLIAPAGAGVYQNVIPLASPHVLSPQQQRTMHQAVPNGSSSSPKRSVSNTVHIPNSSGLAAVQLTPGGPILALQQQSGLQSNVSHSSSIIAPGQALMTGIAGLNPGVGGLQLQAPSVTQPGSVHVIDIPINNTTNGQGLKTSVAGAPLLASAPSLPKAPTVLNVSQIPNLIAINPTSPSGSSSSPSPSSNKTPPTVKVLGVSGSGNGGALLGGMQSPIRGNTL